jgi:hypothetical protein
MPMIANRFERAFAVDFLFQSAQRFLDRLAFLELNFGQITFTSFPQTAADEAGTRPKVPLWSEGTEYFA